MLSFVQVYCFCLFCLDEPLDEVVMICMMYSYKYKKSPLFFYFLALFPL